MTLKVDFLIDYLIIEMKISTNKIIGIFLLIPLFVSAQKENDDIRVGNRLYKDNKYTEAEIEYRKALQKNSKSFEANYNLGNALFKQEKYKEAFEKYKGSMELTNGSKKKIASNFHNLGNTFMSGGQLQEAIASYRMALKNDPKDNETRYNLAYAQALLKKQQQNPDNQGQDDKKDQDKQKDNQDQQDNQDKQPENREPEQQQPQMSKENAQQILEALEQDEKDMQEKTKKAQMKSGRRVEKDW